MSCNKHVSGANTVACKSVLQAELVYHARSLRAQGFGAVDNSSRLAQMITTRKAPRANGGTGTALAHGAFAQVDHARGDFPR